MRSKQFSILVTLECGSERLTAVLPNLPIAVSNLEREILAGAPDNALALMPPKAREGRMLGPLLRR